MSKRAFYDGKKDVKLSEVDVSKIVVSNKVKGIMTPVKFLLVILWMMLFHCVYYYHIKYLENGGTNMSFKIEDDEVYLKYNAIWNKIRELLNGVKLGSDPIHDGSYIKTKVKTFSEVIKTFFDGSEIPKEMVEYTCLACISIDSVLRMDKNIIHRFI